MGDGVSTGHNFGKQAIDQLGICGLVARKVAPMLTDPQEDGAYHLRRLRHHYIIGPVLTIHRKTVRMALLRSTIIAP